MTIQEDIVGFRIRSCRKLLDRQHVGDESKQGKVKYQPLQRQTATGSSKSICKFNLEGSICGLVMHVARSMNSVSSCRFTMRIIFIRRLCQSVAPED